MRYDAGEVITAMVTPFNEKNLELCHFLFTFEVGFQEGAGPAAVDSTVSAMP